MQNLNKKKKNAARGAYNDKAVVEMKANEAGGNSGIGLKSALNDSTYYAGDIRASIIIKCWS